MGVPNPSARAVNAILAAVTTATIALIALFPQASNLGIWKGYRVLAVSPDDCEDRVVSLLDSEHVNGYATEANSLLRTDDLLAPYQPQLAAINAERSRWFSDGGARFFFLPSDGIREKRLANALDGLGLSWSLERHERILAFAVLALSFALISSVLSKNRPLTGSASVPFVIYALSVSGVPGFASALAALSAVALYGDIISGPVTSLTRAHVIGRMRANPVPMVLALVSLAISIAGGAHTIALFALAVTAAGSLAALSPLLGRTFRSVLDTRRLHPRFAYLPIHPASLYRTNGPERRTLIAVGSLFALAFTLGLVSRSVAAPKSLDDSLKRLSIPTPSGYTRSNGFSAESFHEYMRERAVMNAGEPLPDLADFVAARWRLEAFAWNPVYADAPNPVPGDVYGLNGYSQDTSGRIVSEPNDVGVFDDAFVRDALKNRATPLERMLERQGRFISVTRARQDR